MTATVTHLSSPAELVSRSLHLVMCRPEHFEVSYSINPWMDPHVAVDRVRALRQWDTLRTTLTAHGHRVDLMPGAAGWPDMVYAANAGIVHGGRALTSRFAHAQRRGESPLAQTWFGEAGLAVEMAEHTNEGEGDFLTVGERFLAGTGFRSSPSAHREVAEFFGRPVTSLVLVDARFYHLDTALCVLDEHTVAYFPGAFDQVSQQVLAAMFPEAVQASEADAVAFGLNALCDGRRVYLAAAATELQSSLRERGYEPVGIELDELLKGGGGVKCCTLERHP